MPLPSFLMDWRQVVTHCDSVALWIDLCSGTLKVWARKQLSVDQSAEADNSGFSLPALVAMGGSLRLEPMRILETDALVATTKVGSWHEILPYFPVGVHLTNPVSVQAEYFVALSEFPSAIAALRALPNLSELLPQGSEVRFVRGDYFALSPCHERFSPAEPLFACIHFTLLNDPQKVPHVVAAVEKALRPFSARPHWAKLFSLNGKSLERNYGASAHPACASFWERVCSWDPDAKFRNALFEQVVRRQVASVSNRADSVGPLGCAVKPVSTIWLFTRVIPFLLFAGGVSYTIGRKIANMIRRGTSLSL